MSLSSTPQDVITLKFCSETSRASVWAGALAGAVLLGAAGHLLIKFAIMSDKARSHSPESWTAFVTGPLVLGVALYVLGTTLWVFAVSHKEISFLYPLTALTYVIVAVGGRFLFQEPVSKVQWAGILLVAIGTVVMQQEPPDEGITA